MPRLEETIVIALAAARCARAISVDEVSASVRQRISERAEQSPPRHWTRTADELIGCPLCVGWWTSLAISYATPGRQRLLRGAAAAGIQVLLALAERLVSEQGRSAIHVANHVERADMQALDPDGPAPDGSRHQSDTATA